MILKLKSQLVGGFLLMILNALCFAQVEDIVKSRQAYAQGVETYRQKDYTTSLKHFELALQLRPYHPGLMYNVASVSALTGAPNRALSLLNKIADMGLVYAIEEDTDFDSLKNDPKFQQILDKFNQCRKAVANSQVALKLNEKDLVTESVAFDPTNANFFISSIYKRKIVKVDKDGRETDFIAEAQDGIWSLFAMRVDLTGKSLWVSSSAIPQGRDMLPENLGKAGMFEYDLKGGQLRKMFIFAKDTLEHIFGDFVLHSKGSIYISDSKTNAVYLLSPEKNKYTVFIAPGNFESLQGMAFSDNEKRLFVADYSQGLFGIDMQSKTITKLNTPENICTLGIDGLYFYKNSLIATQNGVRPHRVVQLKLNSALNAVESAKILEANNPDMEDPTLGNIVNGTFYFIANSQWGSFKKDGTLPPDAELKNPLIMKIALE